MLCDTASPNVATLARSTDGIEESIQRRQIPRWQQYSTTSVRWGTYSGERAFFSLFLSLWLESLPPVVAMDCFIRLLLKLVLQSTNQFTISNIRNHHTLWPLTPVEKSLQHLPSLRKTVLLSPSYLHKHLTKLDVLTICLFLILRTHLPQSTFKTHKKVDICTVRLAS